MMSSCLLTPPYTLLRFLLSASLLTPPLVSAFASPMQDADHLMKQGQLALAMEKTEQILATKPKDAKARFMKGLILARMGKREDAIAMFTHLTEEYPELPEPYNNLAVLYAQLGQLEKAKQALEMAIRIHPAYAMAHENLGDLYTIMANQAYDRALQIDSANARVQSKQALILDLMANTARQTGVVPYTEADTGELTIQVTETDILAAASPELIARKPGTAPQSVQSNLAISAEWKSEVEQAVRQWAEAWSAKDLEAYFAAYDKAFQTPSGQPRSAWEAERRRRIGKAEPIMLDIKNLQIALKGERAIARFRQYYRSGKLKFATNKTLLLYRRAGKWLIQQEQVSN